jgi:hypothetical protein
VNYYEKPINEPINLQIFNLHQFPITVGKKPKILRKSLYIPHFYPIQNSVSYKVLRFLLNQPACYTDTFGIYLALYTLITY